MHYVTVGLAVFAFGSFWWARRWFFRRSPGTPRHRSGLRLVGPVLGVVLIALVASNITRSPPSGQFVAIGFLVASLILFWLTIRAFRSSRPNIAMTRGAPDELVTTGPYGFVRHPFYVSYLLFWIGCAFATAGIIGIIVVATMLVLYLRAALVEESTMLQSQVGERYAEYAAKTGMFVPRFLPR